MDTIDLLVKNTKENPNMLDNNELYNINSLYKLDYCDIICYNIIDRGVMKMNRDDEGVAV